MYQFALVFYFPVRLPHNFQKGCLNAEEDREQNLNSVPELEKKYLKVWWRRDCFLLSLAWVGVVFGEDYLKLVCKSDF